MLSPKVSVIVPVYNTEKYLMRCVDSILAQTFTDFELLLINDGSMDCSGAICDSYAQKDKRIRVFHKPNEGVCSARNLGIRNAQGSWIIYIDSDDWIKYNCLEIQLSAANEEGSEIVFPDISFITRTSKKTARIYNWEKQGIEGIKEFIISSGTFLCGTLHKKALYRNLHIESPQNITYAEDFHLLIRLCYYAHKISHICIPLYNYWQHPSSVTHNLDSKTLNDEIFVYIELINFFKLHNIYDLIEKEMSWRLIKACQDLLLEKSTFSKFVCTYPVKNKYIISCPFIGTKMKIMGWCLTHGFSIITRGIVYMRNILKR